MSVKIIRLISGEELISNVTETESTVTLKDPAVLIPSPEGKLLLARWIPYGNVENGITLDKKNLIFIIDPVKELGTHYTTVIVNNLVVPGKNIVEPSGNSGLKLTV